MQWLELSVRVPPEMVEPVVEMVQRYGGQRAVVEEAGGFNPDEGESADATLPVTVRTYLPQNRGTSARRGRIEAGLRLLSLIQPLEILPPQTIAEQDWEEAWKAHFHLVRVGRRLVIRPPWQEYAARGDEIVLTVDPGMAFGTGHHPTTRMCLELMEPLVRPGTRVLDLGAGSGILTLAAAALGAGSVLALDTDPVAARVGRRNLRENGLGTRARLLRGTLPQGRASGIHLALANISARVLIEQAAELFRCLVPGGTLIASGVLEEREADVASSLEEAGLRLQELRRTEDWVAMRLERPI
jgi:ribosomal protein L11 methyltransferase